MPTSSDRPRRSPWWWFAVAISLANAAGVLGFFALRFLLPRLPAPLALISYGGPFLFAPLLLLLPLAFLLRSRAAAISTMAVLVLFAVLYGPLFVPRLAPAPALTGEPLSVMTFNLGAYRAPPERLVSVIESENADVVAVQELVPATARALRDGLGTRYPYTILEPTAADTGLLSRHPIVASERFRPAGFGRLALHTVLDINGRLVQVIVVHPRPPGFRWRRRWPLAVGVSYDALSKEITDVARRAAALPGPVLVLGDLNISEQTPAYDRLAGVLGDTFREAGWGFGLTFPYRLQIDGTVVPRPLVRIDYVFHSSELYVREARVGCRGGSDHCYVVARLQRILER